MAEDIGTGSADKGYHFFEPEVAVEMAEEDIAAAAAAAASLRRHRHPKTCPDHPHCPIHQAELLISQRYPALHHPQDRHLRHLVGEEENEEARIALEIVEMAQFLRRPLLALEN